MRNVKMLLNVILQSRIVLCSLVVHDRIANSYRTCEEQVEDKNHYTEIREKVLVKP